MKFLFDLFPVIIFFAAFKYAGIYTATALAIVATFAQIGYLLARGRKVEPLLWVSLVIIVVFGGATLVFQDETFIKWKPSILYWLFSGVLAVAHVAFKKNLIRSMLGAQLQMPDSAWAKLVWCWVAFFLAMGVLNLIIAYHYSTDAWVNFKMFGGMGLMLAFVIGQGLFLAKYIESEEKR